MAISRFVLFFLETCVLISDHLYAVYDRVVFIYIQNHTCVVFGGGLGESMV